MSSTGSMKWNFMFSFFISFGPLFIEFKACKGNFTNVGKRYAYNALIRPLKFNIGYWTRGLQLLCCWPVKHWQQKDVQQLDHQLSSVISFACQLLACRGSDKLTPTNGNHLPPSHAKPVSLSLAVLSIKCLVGSNFSAIGFFFLRPFRFMCDREYSYMRLVSHSVGNFVRVSEC